jgi:DNA-directed RNA polymerase subunit RPC12/RpoP
MANIYVCNRCHETKSISNSIHERGPFRPNKPTEYGPGLNSRYNILCGECWNKFSTAISKEREYYDKQLESIVEDCEDEIRGMLP